MVNWEIFWTAAGSVVAIVALTYGMLRNFKSDMKESFVKIKEDIRDIKEDIKDIRKEISLINQKISSIETKIEERSLKVIYTTRALEEKALNQ